MRRLIPVVAAVGLLVACSSSSVPELQRYYDAGGLFSARLPSASQWILMPEQKLSSTLDLLGGILALPQTASPSPSNAIGGAGFLQPVNQQQDSSIYSVAAVKVAPDTSVADLGTQLLGETVNPKLTLQRRVIVGGVQGLLVVADHRDDQGNPYYSDASAFFVVDTTGYWIRELFSFGQWNQRRAGFRTIVQSFQPDVPPGLLAVPITRPGLQIQSKLDWPLG